MAELLIFTSLSSHLEEPLADSISGKPFTDVAFYAFSRRIAPGKVGKPRMVVAHSKVLRSSSPYLRALLAGGFAESAERGYDLATLAQESEDYEYESDSDLDDDNEDDDAGPGKASPIVLGKDTTPASQQGEVVPQTASNMQSSSQATSQAMVKIVPMRSVAAKTLKALILYIFTSDICFLPLRSRGLASNRYEDYPVVSRHYGIACSCKSMYRLADEMGFSDLKDDAEAHLMSELTGQNILDESFSRFSSRHEAILRKQVDLLCQNYWTASTRDSLQSKIDKIAKGELPHATRALTLLLLKIPLSSSESATKPVNAKPEVIEPSGKPTSTVWGLPPPVVATTPNSQPAFLTARTIFGTQRPVSPTLPAQAGRA